MFGTKLMEVAFSPAELLLKIIKIKLICTVYSPCSKKHCFAVVLQDSPRPLALRVGRHLALRVALHLWHAQLITMLLLRPFGNSERFVYKTAYSCMYVFKYSTNESFTVLL